MAQNMNGPINVRFVNARKAVADQGNTSNITTPLNYTSISAMRTRLAAINAGYYTAAQLDSMTTNDMVYALRVNDDATSIM
jgi:hypothetical protein